MMPDTKRYLDEIEHRKQGLLIAIQFGHYKVPQYLMDHICTILCRVLDILTKEASK